MPNTEQMRQELVTRFKGRPFVEKIKKMSEAQVVAVYLKITRNIKR